MKNEEKFTYNGKDIPIQSMSVFEFHQDLDDWAQVTNNLSFKDCVRIVEKLRTKNHGEYRIMVGLDI
jgi:hypothetical protein